MGRPVSVCVEMIFRDRPFLERLDRVAETGASAFEFWRWADKDLPAVAERARWLGLRCAGATSWTAFAPRSSPRGRSPRRR
jgi:hydroxypyruvate isomerase